MAERHIYRQNESQRRQSFFWVAFPSGGASRGRIRVEDGHLNINDPACTFKSSPPNSLNNDNTPNLWPLTQYMEEREISESSLQTLLHWRKSCPKIFSFWNLANCILDGAQGISQSQKSSNNLGIFPVSCIIKDEKSKNLITLKAVFLEKENVNNLDYTDAQTIGSRHREMYCLLTLTLYDPPATSHWCPLEACCRPS